jgi:PilZ domain
VAARTLNSHDDIALGARQIGPGTMVAVESDTGAVWKSQVTYVSDRLVGLRGWNLVDSRFRERDIVTLVIGEGDRLVRAKAQVLAASGSLMRIVRRDGSDETKRRVAPRLRVDLDATVTLGPAEAPAQEFEADVIDISSSGCAVRGSMPLPVGASVTVGVRLPGSHTALPGVVVRTWTSDAACVPYAGIQFDPIPGPTAQLLNRFLVDQLRCA